MFAAIMAGGENKRIPVLKGFIEIGGEEIIKSHIRILKEIFGKVVISANEPEHYFRYGLPVIGDTVKRRGPLAGIISVLLATGEEEVFVTACDMPYINPALIRLIIDSRAGDATVPIFGGRPQPLFAVYSKAIIDIGQRVLAGSDQSLTGMLERMKTTYIPESDVIAIDPGGRTFMNINTPEDMSLLIT